MPVPLAHIAIEAEDLPRAMRFYTAVFDWQFEPWGPPNFFHIKGAGVHGALQERREPLPAGRKGIECTFAVADLAASMTQVTAAGGKVLGQPFTIPAVGTLTAIEDTEGNQMIIMAYESAYARELGL